MRVSTAPGGTSKRKPRSSVRWVGHVALLALAVQSNDCCLIPSGYWPEGYR
jgi:hypothetical protein